MTATPGTFCPAIVTRKSGRATPTIPASVNAGTVISTCGTRAAGSIAAPEAATWTPMTTTAVRKAQGAAQRGRSRAARSQTATTGRTAIGFVASPVIGPRQSWRRTPASIAWATEAGMRAMSAPSGGTSPVSTISRPVTMKAPTAAGHPPSTVPVEASSAAPGVDQATVIGIRVRQASTTQDRPMVTLTASSPLEA